MFTLFTLLIIIFWLSISIMEDGLEYTCKEYLKGLFMMLLLAMAIDGFFELIACLARNHFF